MVDQGQTSKPKGSTNILLLGEIKGTVKGIDEKLKAQNGAINGLRVSVNGLRDTVAKLPCDLHAEKIHNLQKTAGVVATEAAQKRKSKRELGIALAAALITGFFTLIGIWISNGCPLP